MASTASDSSDPPTTVVEDTSIDILDGTTTHAPSTISDAGGSTNKLSSASTSRSSSSISSKEKTTDLSEITSSDNTRTTDTAGEALFNVLRHGPSVISHPEQVQKEPHNTSKEHTAEGKHNTPYSKKINPGKRDTNMLRAPKLDHLVRKDEDPHPQNIHPHTQTPMFQRCQTPPKLESPLGNTGTPPAPTENTPSRPKSNGPDGMVNLEDHTRQDSTGIPSLATSIRAETTRRPLVSTNDVNVIHSNSKPQLGRHNPPFTRFRHGNTTNNDSNGQPPLFRNRTNVTHSRDSENSRMETVLRRENLSHGSESQPRLDIDSTPQSPNSPNNHCMPENPLTDSTRPTGATRATVNPEQRNICLRNRRLTLREIDLYTKLQKASQTRCVCVWTRYRLKQVHLFRDEFQETDTAWPSLSQPLSPNTAHELIKVAKYFRQARLLLRFLAHSIEYCTRYSRNCYHEQDLTDELLAYALQELVDQELQLKSSFSYANPDLAQTVQEACCFMQIIPAIQHTIPGILDQIKVTQLNGLRHFCTDETIPNVFPDTSSEEHIWEHPDPSRREQETFLAETSPETSSWIHYTWANPLLIVQNTTTEQLALCEKLFFFLRQTRNHLDLADQYDLLTYDFTENLNNILNIRDVKTEWHQDPYIQLPDNYIEYLHKAHLTESAKLQTAAEQDTQVLKTDKILKAIANQTTYGTKRKQKVKNGKRRAHDSPPSSSPSSSSSSSYSSSNTSVTSTPRSSRVSSTSNDTKLGRSRNLSSTSSSSTSTSSSSHSSSTNSTNSQSQKARHSSKRSKKKQQKMSSRHHSKKHKTRKADRNSTKPPSLSEDIRTYHGTKVPKMEETYTYPHTSKNPTSWSEIYAQERLKFKRFYPEKFDERKARYPGAAREALQLLKLINDGDDQSKSEHTTSVNAAIRALELYYHTIGNDPKITSKEKVLYHASFYMGKRYLKYLKDYEEGVPDQFLPVPEGHVDSPSFKTISQVTTLVKECEDPLQIWKILRQYGVSEKLSKKGFQELLDVLPQKPYIVGFSHLARQAKTTKALAKAVAKNYTDTLIELRRQSLMNLERQPNEKLSMALSRYLPVIDTLKVKQPPETQRDFCRQQGLSIVQKLIAPSLKDWLRKITKKYMAKGRVPDPMALARLADEKESLEDLSHTTTGIKTQINVASANLKYMKLNDGSRSPSPLSDSSYRSSSGERQNKSYNSAQNDKRYGNNRPTRSSRYSTNSPSHREKYMDERRSRRDDDRYRETRHRSYSSETHLKPVHPEQIPRGPTFRNWDDTQYVIMPSRVFTPVPGPMPEHGYDRIYRSIKDYYAQTPTKSKQRNEQREYRQERSLTPEDRYYYREKRTPTTDHPRYHRNPEPRNRDQNQSHKPSQSQRRDRRRQSPSFDRGTSDRQYYNNETDGSGSETTRYRQPRRRSERSDRQQTHTRDRPSKELRAERSRKESYSSDPESSRETYNNDPRRNATPQASRSNSRKRTREDDQESFHRN